MNSHNPRSSHFRPSHGQRMPFAAPSAVTPARIIATDAIFQGEREIGIEHSGALYRLKITRQGKLILNK